MSASRRQRTQSAERKNGMLYREVFVQVVLQRKSERAAAGTHAKRHVQGRGSGVYSHEHKCPLPASSLSTQFDFDGGFNKSQHGRDSSKRHRRLDLRYKPWRDPCATGYIHLGRFLNANSQMTTNTTTTSSWHPIVASRSTSSNDSVLRQRSTLVRFGDWCVTDYRGLIKKCPACPVKMMENEMKHYCTLASVHKIRTSKLHADATVSWRISLLYTNARTASFVASRFIVSSIADTMTVLV